MEPENRPPRIRDLLSELEFENSTESGVPMGGSVRGLGLSIDWQCGGLLDPKTGERKAPNGTFVEHVLLAALQRLEHYQSSRFHCAENTHAIDHIAAALQYLQSRTNRRIAQGVEGTHQGT